MSELDDKLTDAAKAAAQEIVERSLAYFPDLDGDRTSAAAPNTTAKIESIISRHLLSRVAAPKVDKWTKGVPKEYGVYWTRRASDHNSAHVAPRLCQLDRYGNWFFGSEVSTPDAELADYLFLGPITPVAAPIEDNPKAGLCMISGYNHPIGSNPLCPGCEVDRERGLK